MRGVCLPLRAPLTRSRIPFQGRPPRRPRDDRGNADHCLVGVLVRLIDVGRSPPAPGASVSLRRRWRAGEAVSAISAAPRRTGAFRPPADLRRPRLSLNIGFFHIALTGTRSPTPLSSARSGRSSPSSARALFFPRTFVAAAVVGARLALLGAWTMAGMVAPTGNGFGDSLALCRRSPTRAICC